MRQKIKNSAAFSFCNLCFKKAKASRRAAAVLHALEAKVIDIFEAHEEKIRKEKADLKRLVISRA